MNIKLVRLVTGEDILTEFDNGEDTVTFTNPLIVYITPPQGPGQSASVGISQWVPYSDSKEFIINKDKVVFVADAAQDLKKQYDQVFGLGLILPGQRGLLTS
jgi:hypothetical protein